jgi:isochorismate pyruvate lyase
MVGVMSRELPSNERSLAPFRAEIDRIDAEIVVLLARRLEVVKHVIAVKRTEGLAALLPERVEDVVEKVSSRAETEGVPPDLAEKLWRVMIDWVIAYENERLG